MAQPRPVARDPYAFGGWLLRMAHFRTIDRQRRDRRQVPVEDATGRSPGRDDASARSGSIAAPEDRLAHATQPDDAVADRDLAALMWEAAGALAERDQQVLDLQLRHGLTPAEVADCLGINRNASNQLVHRVRYRLAAAVAARVLWRAGSPACPDLRTALARSNARVFDATAVKVATSHADRCNACTERRRISLDPAVLFASLPLLGAPAIQARVAAGLSSGGVPALTGAVAPSGPAAPPAPTASGLAGPGTPPAADAPNVARVPEPGGPPVADAPNVAGVGGSGTSSGPDAATASAEAGPSAPFLPVHRPRRGRFRRAPHVCGLLPQPRRSPCSRGRLVGFVSGEGSRPFSPWRSSGPS